MSSPAAAAPVAIKYKFFDYIPLKTPALRKDNIYEVDTTLLGQRLVSVGLIALAAIGATYLAAASTTVLLVTAVVLTAATVLVRIVDGRLAYRKAQLNALGNITSGNPSLNALKHIQNNVKTALELQYHIKKYKGDLSTIETYDSQGRLWRLMGPLPSLPVFKALIDAKTFKDCFRHSTNFDYFWNLFDEPEYLKYFVENKIVPPTYFNSNRQYSCWKQLMHQGLDADNIFPLLVQYGFDVNAKSDVDSDANELDEQTVLAYFLKLRITNDRGINLPKHTNRKRVDLMIELLIKAGANTKLNEIGLINQAEATDLIKKVQAKIKANS